MHVSNLARRLAGAALVLALVVAGGMLIWLHTTLTGGALRASVASPLSGALGQPVSIGSIAPVVRPRLALTLEDVRVGRTPPGGLDASM
jgi:hypothetical protein